MDLELYTAHILDTIQVSSISNAISLHSEIIDSQANTQTRLQKQSLDTGFCMDTGQVKTGEDAADTYVRMLQEVFRVTPSIAYGIVAEFPTLRELVKVLKDQGPLALEDCRKSTNKDGAFSDKRIGPAISKKIYKVFMERDPGVWIV